MPPTRSCKKFVSHVLSVTALTAIIIATMLACVGLVFENVNPFENRTWITLLIGWISLVLYIFGIFLFFVLSMINLWCKGFTSSEEHSRNLAILSNHTLPESVDENQILLIN